MAVKYLIEARRGDLVSYFVRALPGLPEVFDGHPPVAAKFETYGQADQIMQTITRRPIPGVEHRVVKWRIV